MPYQSTTIITSAAILTALLSGCVTQQPLRAGTAECTSYFERQSGTEQIAVIEHFREKICSKVRDNWLGAPRNSFHASSRIILSSNGQVLVVTITKSSGDIQADAQIRMAIERSSPLPVPDDPEVFQKHFRVLSLNFKSE